MVIIEALLNKDDLARYRSTLEKANWNDGKSTAMGMAASVKRNSQADARDPQVISLANQLLGKLGNHPKLISSALPQRIFPPCFNRYAQDESYGFHVDAAIMRIPGSPDVLRSDVSSTVFLNEPEEYDGGELIIQTEFKEQSVKLNAGDAVVYPSSSLHKVTPVTRGERLAAITWMQSMIADTSLRQTLYELDQSIQNLMTTGQVDRHELDRLHHVYHNLIRQFASV
ncbi:Fe2+-dependent dioxygenase [Alteromonas sp. H39]|uniref:Fe2+-dependent dioxygenase n=1 Tax=Alteromonas sp. H39 TaxID=3389876 RepID=UPI0039E16D2D